MEKNERKSAEIVRDRLKKILPDLKLAYDDAKILANKYGWDMDYWKMSDAYMDLAHEYIGIIDVLEEEGGAE